MKYPDGKIIKVGDRVKLWKGCHGVVVACIDKDEFSSDYPKVEWEYLKNGVLIDSDQAGLIHYLDQKGVWN